MTTILIVDDNPHVRNALRIGRLKNVSSSLYATTWRYLPRPLGHWTEDSLLRFLSKCLMSTTFLRTFSLDALPAASAHQDQLVATGEW